MKRKIFFILTVIFIQTNLFANIAMPGYWNTGTGRTFFPFFKEDSIHFGKVQMKAELITVQLYRGFAVVKGVYKMFNHSNDNLFLRVGFPVNGTLDHPIVQNVMFDELNNLKVLIDGKEVDARTLSDYVNYRYEKYGKVFPFPEIKNPVQSLYADNNNWYVWEANFKANDVTEIIVYYVLNTNDASQLKGYDKDHSNCFAYILESGEAWGKNIEKGKIVVQLMDDLSEDDVDGVYPNYAFKLYEGAYLIYEFENLDPRSDNNVVVRYSERDAKFNFEKITTEGDKYFSKIDEMNIGQKFVLKEIDEPKDDFDVGASFFSPITIIISAVVVLGVLIYGLIAWIF